MFHLHPGSFGLGFEDPNADRDRMHRVALHEARIATEHRAGAHDELALAGSRRLPRFHFAFSGGSTTEPADCSA